MKRNGAALKRFSTLCRTWKQASHERREIEDYRQKAKDVSFIALRWKRFVRFPFVSKNIDNAEC